MASEKLIMEEVSRHRPRLARARPSALMHGAALEPRPPPPILPSL
jgi:hypothetical protein